MKKLAKCLIVEGMVDARQRELERKEEEKGGGELILIEGNP